MSGAPPERIGISEFLESGDSSNGKSFLIENIDLFHDAIVVIGWGDGETTTFRCMKSFLDCGKAITSSVGLRPSQGTVEFRVALDNQSLVLSEGRFLGFLIGMTSVKDLFVNPDEILDVCEILTQLELKRHLWFICEQIVLISSEVGLNEIFQVFQKSFERFESEIDPVGVRFQSAVSHAAFLGLREKKDQLGQPGNRQVLIWMMKNLLSEALRFGTFCQVSEHTDLKSSNLSDCKSPAFLLPAWFQELLIRFPHDVQTSNVELLSKMDGGAVRCHIEALLLSHEFFRLMLGSGFRENEMYRDSRVIELEELSSKSIQLLCLLCYGGKFPEDPSVALVDAILLVRHLEKSQGDEYLRKYALRWVKSVDATGPMFLDVVLETGTCFEGLRSKGEILEAWAAQGKYSSDVLLRKLSEAADRARSLALESENATLNDEVMRLRSQMDTVMQFVGEMRGRVDRLEDQIQVLREVLSEHGIRDRELVSG